jgi:hypothetical protein
VKQDVTIEEAAEFWDTHSLADVPTRIVEIEYAPEGHTTLGTAQADLWDAWSEKGPQGPIEDEDEPEIP